GIPVRVDFVPDGNQRLFVGEEGCVSGRCIEIQWSIVGDESSSVITKLRTFTILAPPQTPWRATRTEAAGDASLPWVSALVDACYWAGESGDAPTAAANISVNLCNAANRRFNYWPKCAAFLTGDKTLRLGDFLRALHSSKYIGRRVNCADMAAALVTYANVIG